jgi:hypothetical protein
MHRIFTDAIRLFANAVLINIRIGSGRALAAASLRHPAEPLLTRPA